MDFVGAGNTESDFLFEASDLQKAFDSAAKARLWELIRKKGVHEHLIEAIRSMYINCRNYERTENRKSKEFVTTTKGQGGILRYSKPPFIHSPNGQPGFGDENRNMWDKNWGKKT
ncbi:hypothetical protein ILUMI_16999 [Ignelater luminosus]|uniref:Reverse transcriptase domain-containing protein n=1 Tax=Ignelater luminosus TaxID=2038154 RepID=A0A8K0CMI9_IGNLU|nr:hypothetical protein ILUMI_16999 [Ignelater luminosus]